MNDLYLIKKETLTNIADNVRSLTGVEGEISLDTMSSKLAEAKQSVDNVIGTLEGFGVEIPEGTNIGDLAGIIENSDSFGGTDTSDATATADEIFAGETAYTADGKVTGTFTIDNELQEQNDLISQITTLVATKANPQGGTDTNDATATASDILSGKTAYVKGVKITGNIPTKAATTYTPTTANQTIAAGTYCSGAQTIKGDANLVAGNIKSGVSIFGVAGTHESGVTPTGTLEITENGTYDVTQYASASVNVAGSSGGGGSVETCTVTINTTKNGKSNARIVGYSYTAIENGEMVAKYITANGNYVTTGVLSNVLCGSVITVMLDGIMSFWTYSGDVVVESLGKWDSSVYPVAFLSAPTVAGSNNSIVFDYED